MPDLGDFLEDVGGPLCVLPSAQVEQALTIWGIPTMGSRSDPVPSSPRSTKRNPGTRRVPCATAGRRPDTLATIPGGHPLPVRPLEGRVALVTGANHGIGASTAVALAGAGADVVVTYLCLDVSDDDPGRPAVYAEQRR